MGQQAASEQGRGYAGRIHRVADLVLQEKGLAHVVEQHQQHDGAAQLVDGGQPRGGRRSHVRCSFGVTGYNITIARFQQALRDADERVHQLRAGSPQASSPERRRSGPGSPAGCHRRSPSRRIGRYRTGWRPFWWPTS
ncbi:hypothetical protein G6F24_016178 [Rhizopus arrhizus]|nr:hypothetical protein G6F24_016178 [Rhizopus arrhizus]